MNEQSTIVVESSDSKIWHLQNTIIDIMYAMVSNNDIVVDMNNEGPCAESLELYDLLDQLCDKVGYDRSRITIKTCNLLETHNTYNINIFSPNNQLNRLQEELKEANKQFKQITNSTKHFGNFIGHGNRLRLILGSYLYTNFKEKTLQTYHTKTDKSYHREFIALEDVLFYKFKYEYFDNSCNFLQNTPLTLDDINTYPIVDLKIYDIMDAYRDIFVDIVCQTYFTGNTFYLDEKIWRPIISKTPFMVQGSRNSIKHLKSLGFKTFSKWWDEGYSEDPPDVQVQGIIENINFLSKFTTDQLNDMYNEMKLVLNHNYDVFMSLTRTSLVEVDLKNK